MQEAVSRTQGHHRPIIWNFNLTQSQWFTRPQCASTDNINNCTLGKRLLASTRGANIRRLHALTLPPDDNSPLKSGLYGYARFLDQRRNGCVKAHQAWKALSENRPLTQTFPPPLPTDRNQAGSSRLRGFGEHSSPIIQ